MISQLTGTISHKDGRFLILDVQGVGYKIHASGETIEKSPSSKVVTFWTHLVVREDALDLYGFLEKDEMEFFEMLISISGIGPKTALSIINLASIPTLKRAVVSGDSSYLTKVSGVGKKNAEKIVLELKDKLIVIYEEGDENTRNESDSLEALKSLGYPEREAREALKKVSKEITDTVEKVRQALKILGSGK
jgi:Holliday junction DNA helicase RuvA